MSVKTKLGMGIAGAVLSVGLIGGGTFAYFSDSVEQTSHFKSGNINLGVNEEAQVEVDDLAPGHSTTKTFKLKNNGSLDMQMVDLKTDYNVIGNNNSEFADKYADQINAQFLGDNEKVLAEASLKELKAYDVKGGIDQDLINQYIGEIEPKGDREIDVKFTFEDNGKDQNEFQNQNLKLNWTFEAQQTAGEEK